MCNFLWWQHVSVSNKKENLDIGWNCDKRDANCRGNEIFKLAENNGTLIIRMNNFQSRKLVIFYFTWTMRVINRDRLGIARALINRHNSGYYLFLRSSLWRTAVKWISAKFKEIMLHFYDSPKRCKIYSRYFLFIAFLIRFKVQFKCIPVDDCRQVNGTHWQSYAICCNMNFVLNEHNYTLLRACKIRSFTVISDISSQNKICFRLA